MSRYVGIILGLLGVIFIAESALAAGTAKPLPTPVPSAPTPDKYLDENFPEHPTHPTHPKGCPADLSQLTASIKRAVTPVGFQNFYIPDAHKITPDGFNFYKAIEEKQRDFDAPRHI